jgi:hypothetical protein
MQFTQLHRDWIVREMNLRGIGVGRYFAPIHLQPIYKHWATWTNLQVTEEIAPRTLALPFFNRLENDQIEEVCSNLTELVDFASQMRKNNAIRDELETRFASERDSDATAQTPTQSRIPLPMCSPRPKISD